MPLQVHNCTIYLCSLDVWNIYIDDRCIAASIKERSSSGVVLTTSLQAESGEKNGFYHSSSNSSHSHPVCLTSYQVGHRFICCCWHFLWYQCQFVFFSADKQWLEHASALPCASPSRSDHWSSLCVCKIIWSSMYIVSILSDHWSFLCVCKIIWLSMYIVSILSDRYHGSFLCFVLVFSDSSLGYVLIVTQFW